MSRRRTGKKVILDENYRGKIGCTRFTVQILVCSFLDTSLNRSPVDENVSFTVLSPNFNEGIPMTMETNPAYISASLPIRVMHHFENT